ncbi:hypothetical protein LJB75_00145 [Bacteroidales bacterium OttesenSCG-928-L19]|nr:hypothetical protein [Bacteroidales bacterium OttesenSCG-928-L19]
MEGGCGVVVPVCEYYNMLQFEYPELTPFQYASNNPVSMRESWGEVRGIIHNKQLCTTLHLFQITKYNYQKTKEMKNSFYQ